MPTLPAPSSSRTLVALIVGLLAASTSEAFGQPTLRASSPFVAAAPAFAPEYPVIDRYRVGFDLGPRPGGAAPVMQDAPASKKPFVLAVVLASAGSVIGLFAGAAAGGTGSSGSEDYSDAITGAILGSWLGAATGSAAAGGHFGRSLAGSAAGVLLGLKTAKNTSHHVVVLLITHGLTTAAAGR